MPWRNGGVIGQRNLPSGAGASGVWRLSEIESARRTGAWPTVAILPDISGLLVWLDANAVSTLLTSAGGETAVAMNGEVAQWSDSSGNGRNAVQGTIASRPILATSAENGRRCVRFDGVNDFITGSHGAGTNSPHTVIVALRTTALGGGADKSAIIMGNRLVGTSARAFYGIPFGFNTANYGVRSPFRDATVSPAVSRTTTPFLAYSIRVSTENSRVGVSRTFYNIASVMPLTLNNDFEIGRSSPFDSVSFTPMDVHEVLIYNSSLTDSDVNSVLDYFSIKWGTP